VELQDVVTDVAAALIGVDRCGTPFKGFRLGVGPYGEPQLLRAVAKHLQYAPVLSWRGSHEEDPGPIDFGSMGARVQARPTILGQRQGGRGLVGQLTPSLHGQR